MKLFILLLCFTIPPFLFAQSPDDKITIDMGKSNLKEFIKVIENQTKYRFVYGEEIEGSIPLTIRVTNMSLKEVLLKTFDNKEISYEIKGSHIILKREKKETNILSGQRFTISGYITDEMSGETMIGASIYNLVSGEGTITNEYGFYSLTIPAGKVEIRYSYVGCEPQNIKIHLQSNIEQNIKLNSRKELVEIVVYGDRAETGIHAIQMGALDIPLDVMKNTPALLGEADVMKTIQMMPGVQAGTEGSAGVYVRGGGIDENLILLDGVPLYNVDHLFGFFSVFTPEAIKKVSLFKGSFPARFGGRLSSVIDVRTNDGDMQNYHGTIGIGLLSGKLQLEGPIVKDRTSFNISGRRSYLDLLTRPFMNKNDKVSYYFYDMNAKINHRFNDKSRLFVSFYNGKDKMYNQFRENYGDYSSKDEANLHWGNLLSAVKWNYQLNAKLFSNTTLAYTHYRFNVNSQYMQKSKSQNYNNDYRSKYSSGIKDIAFNVDFDYHPLPRHDVKFGVGYLNHRFVPEVHTSRIKNNEGEMSRDTTYSSMSDSRIKAYEANVYVEDNFNINSRWSANIGFHLSLFNVENKTYTSFQPRLSTRYQLTGDIAMKAAYTKMSQYIHMLSGYSITMPTDLWVPTTPAIKPMEAHQFSTGAYYTGFNEWELSVEVYYKHMHNVLEYKDGATFFGSSHNWESKVEMGKGRAMGIEFLAQKKMGQTTGWIAYTLAKSDRKFGKNGINEGKRFPYKYDRRNHLNLVVNHKFSDKIDIGASWEFYTGGTTTVGEERTFVMRPVDDPDSMWQDHLFEVDYIKNRNNYRMPSSHRLNVGINFNKKTKRGIRTWNISVYNIYNAMNPNFIHRVRTFEKDGEEEESPKTILRKVTILPFIPSVSYIYKF